MNANNVKHARDAGNVLILSVVMVALLVASGLGYMKWAADEKYDSMYEKATIQAYFLAQTGVIERGLFDLRSTSIKKLPTRGKLLPAGEVKKVGTYIHNRLEPVNTARLDVGRRTEVYDVYSTGRVPFNLDNERHGVGYIERTVKMRARRKSPAEVFYFTQIEVTRRGEIIWFFGMDTLYGPVWSMDRIGMKGRPVFYDDVWTAQSSFIQGEAYNPEFHKQPRFNVPFFELPDSAVTIRQNARPFIDDNHGRLMTWIRFMGAEGADVFQYPMGTAPNDCLVNHIPPLDNGGVFINGEVRLEGEVAGTMTIGSAKNMWLIDDVKYAGSNGIGEFDDSSGGFTPTLGLVSERNIIIKNNERNGKENGVEVNQNDMRRHSIIIDAFLLALNESFTFEDQNDEGDRYVCPNPPQKDERGIIYLKGVVWQKRRGYVHRSNHNGTGYGKHYAYDKRLKFNPPPYLIDISDEGGRGVWDVMNWHEERAER